MRGKIGVDFMVFFLEKTIAYRISQEWSAYLSQISLYMVMMLASEQGEWVDGSFISLIQEGNGN